MQPKGIASFPYLKPIQGQGTVKFSFIDVPQIHNKGNVTGLFFTTPFILFAGIPIISMFLRKKSKTTPDFSSHTTFIYKWTSASLFGSFLLGFASLLAYYWVQIRFLADCISPLLLLSVLGFWQGYQALNSKPTSRRIYLFIGISLIVVSICNKQFIGLLRKCIWIPNLWHRFLKSVFSLASLQIVPQRFNLNSSPAIQTTYFDLHIPNLRR